MSSSIIFLLLAVVVESFCSVKNRSSSVYVQNTEGAGFLTKSLRKKTFVDSSHLGNVHLL